MKTQAYKHVHRHHVFLFLYVYKPEASGWLVSWLHSNHIYPFEVPWGWGRTRKKRNQFFFFCSLYLYTKKNYAGVPHCRRSVQKKKKKEGYSVSSPRFNIRVETVSILSFFHFLQALISRFLSFHTAVRDVGELVSLYNIDPILQHVFKLNEV